MEYLSFIIFPIIGAIIGAVTNEIAIKMLFRPYKAIFFLGKQLPFTPGVIPSQREMIAANIAKTFEKNLLSGDEIHKIVTSDNVRNILDAKIDSFIKEKLGAFAGMVSGYKKDIVDNILEGIEEMADEAIAHGGELNIGQKIEQKINEMDIEVLENIILDVAKKQLQHITFFGGVLGFLIGLVQAGISLFI